MTNLSSESKFHIEDSLKDGHSIRCFSSGFSLQVVRIITPEGQLVGYGEAPQFEFAVADAAENYVTGEDYAKQYRNADARYPHAVYGSHEVSSQIDKELYDGAKLLARWSVDHVIAELHNLTPIPIWSEKFDAPGALPMVVEQYGRSWLLEPDPNGGAFIRSLFTKDGQDDGFADLMKVGVGENLDEAISSALIGTPVESDFNQFLGNPPPPDKPFNVHFGDNY